ncbi:hypothetical protein AAU57_13345 [Nonlabens sp. YIK11]|uniref:hypothetical protein n=1 Tax=Nonlabens sp. YIK11 TaxID=1453349 RepID=UPI0006DBDBE3|nr:hypothetical protein [Nonlabens sp. YIK11]KQC34209.1 hypothetical protein AAU57_13345 [Nonlabens sp. YIK11]
MLGKAQIGIGTDAPATGTILHIEDVDGAEKSGVLFPKVHLTSLSDTDPLPSSIKLGTLVYNTNVNLQTGYYYWTVTKWQRLNAAIGAMAKFANENQDTSNNLNDPTGVKASIFGDVAAEPIFNDGPNLYIRLDNKNLRITENGRYQITVNLSMASSINQAQVEARLQVNDTGLGPYFRSSEMDPNSGSTNGSISFTQTLELSAGDELSILCKAVAPEFTGTAFFNRANASSFFIEKVLDLP